MLDTTTSVVQYRGDGVNRVFPIPFAFLENAHIHAHTTPGDGTARTLAAGTDYSIERAGDAADLRLLAEDLPAGQLLTIRRLLPLTQEIFFHNQGPNSPLAMEEAADRLTMISQQLQTEIDRCVRAPNAESAMALSIAAAANSARLAAVESALTSGAAADHEHTEGDIIGLTGALAGKADAAIADGKADRIHSHGFHEIDGLGAMASAADAPGDGGYYVRRDCAWAALPSSPPASGGSDGGTAGGGFVGDIRLLPFRSDELPGGWHFCDGRAFAETSNQGRALLSLPPSYRQDWGIVLESGMIHVPNLFDEETGAGFFLRGVDNRTRIPGNRQGDAIRNITGKYDPKGAGGGAVVKAGGSNPGSTLEGAFTAQIKYEKNFTPAFANTGLSTGADLLFDASRIVPTAEENRPVNVGMTPAIYLGV